MRKLASIQTVSCVEPIPNADAIERFRVLGWTVVGKKGEFREGDRVIYCEIDSLLPEWPEFEFLRAGSFKPAIVEGNEVLQRAGFRIRTIKLRGQVSQGLCLPLSLLPPGVSTELGTDVTDALQIIKYDPPLPAGMSGKAKGPFPGFLPKTDETRIQVLLPLLETHRGKTFHITEKLDGTSFTAFLHNGQFGICSRNLLLDESDVTSAPGRLSQELDLPARLRAIQSQYGFSPAIQGEVIGPGVQKNRYALMRPELYVFSLIDILQGRLVDREVALQILESSGFRTVPRLGSIILNHTVDELVKLAEGYSQLNPRTLREGLVFRPDIDIDEPLIGGRLSFKVINPQFLLKYDE